MRKRRRSRVHRSVKFAAAEVAWLAELSPRPMKRPPAGSLPELLPRKKKSPRFARELGYRRPLPRKTPQFRSRDDYYILETTVLRNNDHGRCGGIMHRNDKHLRSSVGEERCGNASVLWSGNFDIPVPVISGGVCDGLT